VGQVNRIPNGFLDLLGVQSLGRNPPLFSDAISPVVDIFELYAAQTLSVHSVDWLHTVTGDSTVLFVPEGETWMLRGLSIETAIMVGGTQQNVSFLAQDFARGKTGAATPEMCIWNTGPLNPIANARESRGFMLPSPLALTSGTVLIAKVYDRDGLGARTDNVTWLINRFNS